MAATGEEGFYRLNAETFDAVLLDWMLPGRDGLEILQTLRARGVRTPVLLLTARDALEDRVLGLNGGADDYLIKPFAFEELLARLRALLRRVADGMVEQPPPTLRNVADLTLESRRAACAAWRTRHRPDRARVRPACMFAQPWR